MSSSSQEEGGEEKPKIFNPRDGLTEDQLAILDQFKANIQDALITEYEKNWCTEMTLCRYHYHYHYHYHHFHSFISFLNCFFKLFIYFFAFFFFN